MIKPRFTHVGFFLMHVAMLLAYDSIVLPTVVFSDDHDHSVRLPSTLSATFQEDVQFLKEETVVTAMRYEQPMSEAPANIYVITAADIRHSGATDLPTILRQVPGIEVMHTSGADINVSARGDNQLLANKMLVLVDGRSIFEDAQGQVYWKLIPVTLPEIKRIEVLLGPASNIYGFNAFDGIIHIITKSPDEMPGTRFQIGGGEFGTLTTAAVHSGRYGDLGYRFSAGWDQNRQWQDRDTLAVRGYKWNIHLEHPLPDAARVKVSGGVVNTNRFSGLVSEVSRLDQEPLHANVYVRYEHPQFFLRAFWNRFQDQAITRTVPSLSPVFQFSDRNGRAAFDSQTDVYDVVGQHTFKLGSSHHVISGINYRYIAFSNNFLDSFARENRLGFYVNDEWIIWPQLTAIAGVRYDLDTAINPTWSPRFALLFSPIPSHTLRASISIAHRPPTLVEGNVDSQVRVTLPSPLGTTVQRNRGSDNLGPERILSTELAYQGWFFHHRVRVRAAAFYNHLSDLISFGPSGSGINDPVRPTNSGTAEIYGGEVGLEFHMTEWFSGFANYAYQKIDQTFTGLSQRTGPQSKFNIGLRGHWQNGVSGQATVHYVEGTEWPLAEAFPIVATFGGTTPNATVDSYTLLNLRGAYRFWDDRVEFAISVFNALNDRHKEHPLGDTIGSRVLGWLTVKLG